MSFPFGIAPPEALRHPRNDEFLTAQRSSRGTPIDGTSTPIEPLTHDGAVDAALGPFTPRKRIVFPDPVAFRYLEEDPCVQVVERSRVLYGYELYLVEQWACSRKAPTLVVVTYTGDERHSIVVGVLSIPEDEALWSTKLRAYFKATRQTQARSKSTDLGELMVTNLSSFPSSLTVILIPDGDVRKHRTKFFVNEDLKRLGCSGRSGLTLSDPAEGTRAKFLSLYRTSEKIPFFTSVMELVKLCQVALHIFGILDQEYVDGLLCDMTETAIGNWWTELGSEHYNFEPTDGILGPTTVAALLGLLMGARNRLYSYGAPVQKDVFDIESTKRGIAYFQKSFKLERTRRLDRQTLLNLHTVTAKAAAGGEGWGVQRAVKSRVTEYGGKRGEIVMGMVSGKDKGGLADTETLDLDRFIGLASGERAKWLWYGKPRRMLTEQQSHEADRAAASFGGDDLNEPYMHRVITQLIDDDPEMKRKEDLQPVYSDIASRSATNLVDTPGDRDNLRKTMFKNVTGKISGARGRIKDTVGSSKRGHASRLSVGGKDSFLEQANGATGLPAAADNASSATIGGLNRTFTWKNKPQEYLDAMQRGEGLNSLSRTPTGSRYPSSLALDSKSRKKESEIAKDLYHIGSEIRQDVLPQAPSGAGSVVDENDLQGPLLDAERRNEPQQLELSRRRSFCVSVFSISHEMNEDRWPRRVSFGDAEEAVLTWEEVIDLSDDVDALGQAEAYAEIAKHLQATIDNIADKVEPWVDEKLRRVSLLDERFARDKTQLHALYQQLNDACQQVRYNSDELLAEERANLTESVKEIEVLVARLDYEINALVSKVNDVEDGVRNFERQVEDVEKRAEELKRQLEKESWVHWFVRTVTGVGTGPQILRDRVGSVGRK